MAAVPAVESRFRASVALAVVPAVRVAVAEGLVAEATPGRVVPRDVLEVAVVEPTAGFRVAVVPVVDLPGLVIKVLVLLVVEVTDFFSSSLALTLARLRCVAVVEDDVGRRTVLVVEVGGRVGGLLSPPVVVREAVVGAFAAVVVVVVPGRRAAVPAAAVEVLAAAVVLAVAVGRVAAGEAGVELLAVERGVGGEGV